MHHSRWSAKGSILVLLALLSACATVQAPPAPEAPIAQPEEHAPPRLRSPFVEPPGVINKEVTQANVSSTICVPGWTATVRPPTSYTQELKRTMLRRAGADPNTAIVYELDHLIPLALGGHPRSEDNLWLQKWDGQWNAKIKDRLERKLQLMVCAGSISLHAARTAIRHDWHAAYGKYVAADPTATPRGPESEEDEVVE